MVNDIIAELLELDMEHKPESAVVGRVSHQAEEKNTLKVWNKGLAWYLSLQRTCSRSWDTAFWV